MKKVLLCATLLFSVLLQGLAQQNKVPIIPYPTNIEIGTGSFQLSPRTQLVLKDGGRFANEIMFMQSLLYPVFDQYLSTDKGNNTIEFVFSDEVSAEEGYQLNITQSTIIIKASSTKGAFYAVQSLRQLMPYQIELGTRMPTISIPILQIIDQPAFEWRGSMIDISRHFFSLEYMKKHIDRLAFYKMNKLHIHLTDDQGWRIEIKKYPELTEQGAWRYYNNHDSVCIKQSNEEPNFKIDPRYIVRKGEGKDIYGGYYSQDQIKELIKYATSKHIEIIPEIDMPGHMMTAISTYPYLTDSKHTGWGKDFSTPLCPCKEDVYKFVENVLSEVIDLFPSQYIHIGADEVEKTTWAESELCQELMVNEGIKNVNELQSYFIHKIQDFIESKGKKVIGWDESLEGGINSNVNIMYWRGWASDAPRKAVMNGNKVIMTPTNPLYFDYLPNKSSLYNVYHMDVVYDNIPADKVSLIRGAQANLWTETIPTENRADFMLFPRLTALAERVWTNKDLYSSYSERLLAHYPRLDVLGVNYRLPDVQGFAQESVIIGETFFNVKSPLPSMNIHYTTDGSVPKLHSPMLKEPFPVKHAQEIRFALFSQWGVRGEIYNINYKESKTKESIKNKKVKAGLSCDFYKQSIDKTTKIKGKADKHFTTKNFSVPSEAKAASFGLRYEGYIDVPETGVYNFYLTCDDGGILYIGDEIIINNEGPHPPVEKSGQASLEKGLHRIRLDFVEAGGGYTLRLQYGTENQEMTDIPNEWLKH